MRLCYHWLMIHEQLWSFSIFIWNDEEELGEANMLLYPRRRWWTCGRRFVLGAAGRLWFTCSLFVIVPKGIGFVYFHYKWNNSQIKVKKVVVVVFFSSFRSFLGCDSCGSSLLCLFSSSTFISLSTLLCSFISSSHLPLPHHVRHF